MRKSLLGTGAVALLALTACGDSVNVTNYNNPDVDRVFATPAGIESFVGGLGVQVNNPMRATESVNTQSKVLAGENFASVANFGMAARGVIPRSIISNELGNDNQGGNFANFNSFGRLGRVASVALAALDQRIAEGAIYPAADYARVKAFAFMIVGQTLGNVSMAYDSAAIVTPETAPPGNTPEPLAYYPDVNIAALRMLDSALAYTGTMSSLPGTWINGNTMTGAQFALYVNSLQARFRAGVARTPAERAAVDWAAVIADATAGITANHTVSVGAGSGWGAAFDIAQMYVAGGWHSAPMLYLGGADTSGAFASWVAVPNINDRRAFLVVTPDLRWPQGLTRAAQQDATNRTSGTSNIVPVGPRYFINRTAGNDIVLASWGESFYDHRRWGSIQSNSGTGNYVDFSLAENNLLRAEGLIRTGQPALALPFINARRTASGLPAATVAGAPTPGGPNSCIPKMPTAGSPNTLTCGDLLETLKYEKRIETMYTGYMTWFTDSRGWGDLVEGTILEWPVPYQEFQSRGKLSGFPNGERRAGPSTYGY